jgi:hypothetical protein
VCLLQYKSAIQNIPTSLPTLMLNGKAMKCPVNLTRFWGCTDVGQVRELSVINNLLWWLHSCDYILIILLTSYLISQTRKLKSTSTSTVSQLGNIREFWEIPFTPSVFSYFICLKRVARQELWWKHPKFVRERKSM